MAELERFLLAQDGVFDTALLEITAGRKRTHWMWFVFPQIAGLGLSAMAQRYAIDGLAEAQRYLAHPILGVRLATITDAALAWAGKRTALAIFGEVDAMKLRSSATLFEAAGGGARFLQILDAFFDGSRDPATLNRLGTTFTAGDNGLPADPARS